MNQQALEYCKDRYKKIKHKELDLENPQLFTEKIQWKKFFDHNPLYTITSDKLKIYEWLEDIKSPVMPPKLLGYVDRPELPKLPDKWIAKANHGSGWNLTHEHKTPRIKFKEWLNTRYAPYAGEWGYEGIKPAIIFQEYIENVSEYKYFVINGKIAMIQHLIYSPDHDWKKTQCIQYDKNWKMYDVDWIQKSPEKTYTEKPEQFDLMNETALHIGKHFKNTFVRVDFMITEGKTYLSEITHYPTSGFMIIMPIDFDYKLGKLWKIK